MHKINYLTSLFAVFAFSACGGEEFEELTPDTPDMAELPDEIEIQQKNLIDDLYAFAIVTNDLTFHAGDYYAPASNSHSTTFCTPADLGPIGPGCLAHHDGNNPTNELNGYLHFPPQSCLHKYHTLQFQFQSTGFGFGSGPPFISEVDLNYRWHDPAGVWQPSLNDTFYDTQGVSTWRTYNIAWNASCPTTGDIIQFVVRNDFSADGGDLSAVSIIWANFLYSLPPIPQSFAVATALEPEVGTPNVQRAHASWTFAGGCSQTTNCAGFEVSVDGGTAMTVSGGAAARTYQESITTNHTYKVRTIGYYGDRSAWTLIITASYITPLGTPGGTFTARNGVSGCGTNETCMIVSLPTPPVGCTTPYQFRWWTAGTATGSSYVLITGATTANPSASSLSYFHCGAASNCGGLNSHLAVNVVCTGGQEGALLERTAM